MDISASHVSPGMKLPPPRVRILLKIHLCRAGQRMLKPVLTVSGPRAGEEQNGDREEIDGEKSKRKVPLVRYLPPNANTVRIHRPHFTCSPSSIQLGQGPDSLAFPLVCALRQKHLPHKTHRQEGPEGEGREGQSLQRAHDR